MVDRLGLAYALGICPGRGVGAIAPGGQASLNSASTIQISAGAECANSGSVFWQG